MTTDAVFPEDRLNIAAEVHFCGRLSGEGCAEEASSKNGFCNRHSAYSTTRTVGAVYDRAVMAVMNLGRM